jgi:hypothetical protein
VGVRIDIAYWYETSQFAIAPRMGFRFSSDLGGDDTFFELPFDLGAYYIAFLEINNQTNPQSLTAGVSVFF